MPLVPSRVLARWGWGWVRGRAQDCPKEAGRDAGDQKGLALPLKLESMCLEIGTLVSVAAWAFFPSGVQVPS